MALFKATVNASKVAATLTDYPAYVDLSEMPASFWSTVSNGGGDIRVYADEAKTTELAREVVSCNTSTETGELHVKIPSLTTSTVIYIDVDGTRTEPAVDSAYGRNAVWTGYVLVAHDGGGTDSTGNNSPTANGGVTAGGVTGKIGNATNFDGTDDRFSLTSTPFNPSEYSNQLNISGWIKNTIPTGGFSFNHILAKGTSGEWSYSAYQSGDGFRAVQWQSSGTSYRGLNASTALETNDGDWHLFSVNFSVAELEMFIDNAFSSVVTTSTGTWVTSGTANANIGARADNSGWYAGDIDEIRVRKTLMSQDWHTTEYNNQSDVASFWTIEQVVSGVNPAIARRRLLAR